MTLFPEILQSNGNLEIFFAPRDPPLSYVNNVEVVLDYDQSESIIGVEILHLKSQAGARGLERIEKVLARKTKGMFYSYDIECDAFYLKIKDGYSPVQKSLDGVLVLNKKGQILGIKADVGK